MQSSTTTSDCTLGLKNDVVEKNENKYLVQLKVKRVTSTEKLILFVQNK